MRWIRISEETATKNKHRHGRERQEQQSAEKRVAMGAAAVAVELEAEDKAEKVAETAETDSGAEIAGDERNSAAQAETGVLNDRLKQTLAELENFRKRGEHEKAQAFGLGARLVLEKFLPIIDNLERNVAQVPESGDSGIKAYAEGMDMIYRQLLKNLKEAGAEAIDAKGKPFDPTCHNAVIHEDNETLGEDAVSEELQKGYLYKGSILRHNIVRVAN